MEKLSVWMRLDAFGRAWSMEAGTQEMMRQGHFDSSGTNELVSVADERQTTVHVASPGMGYLFPETDR